MERRFEVTSGSSSSRTRPETARNIGFVGTYIPRRCGIATFTTDLVAAVAGQDPDARISVIAVNDERDAYSYPPEVRFEIAQNVLGQYCKTADFLNMDLLDVVCVQHEFGIFGGNDGTHILRMIDQLRMPVVVTLHTILSRPSAYQRQLVHEIAGASDRLIVMSETGRRQLEEIYEIDGRRIAVVPHGIPDVPFVDPCFHKDQFGIDGRKAILTFGLLSPGKGIETMIRALPAIVGRHPDAVYIVLGATHPHVRRQSGESYRRQLRRLADELGVGEHLVFHDHFVDRRKLCEWLAAADVYVMPYPNEDQITSGTLAYAMGAGNAVVSTPFWHAREMLADGRGMLAGFGDSDAFAAAVNRLLDNESERQTMRKRAYTYTRDHVWRRVGRQYLEIFSDVLAQRRREPQPYFQLEKNGDVVTTTVPEIRLDHLRRLTDDVGVLQHALYMLPDRDYGYCTDDNARALITSLKMRPYTDEFAYLDELTVRYLSYLRHAFNDETGAFRNFMGYDRTWQERIGAHDAHGRGIWAAGEIAGKGFDERLRGAGLSLLHRALPHLHRIRDLRSRAMALLGITAALTEYEGDRSLIDAQRSLTEGLTREFRNRSKDAGWFWPEDTLTYANATVPQALIFAGTHLQRPEAVELGLGALRWLAGVQCIDDHFVPIGNRGWYPRGGERARFDQQPIEAACSVAAYLAAYRTTTDDYWIEEARRAFRWFLGYNDVGVSLYDEGTGGCRDGLAEIGANENQGAESTLAWLSALADMQELQATGSLALLDDDSSQSGAGILPEKTTRLAS